MGTCYSLLGRTSLLAVTISIKPSPTNPDERTTIVASFGKCFGSDARDENFRPQLLNVLCALLIAFTNRVTGSFIEIIEAHNSAAQHYYLCQRWVHIFIVGTRNLEGENNTSKVPLNQERSWAEVVKGKAQEPMTR